MNQLNQLRIVRGDASPEEIAALLVALSAAPPSQPEAVPTRQSWRDPARRMRGATGPGGAWRPGPGAWRASALPD
ncbi:hypothetical protein Aph01nite_02930 [Acrocarpospora phusangensis]|uniref:Acetyl-CoA carboxylase biotin carboxyl carrier protein subunit n=1 Tax=Acrocarpospora phusangensis TaxID=1070424 RepID=A0A919Q4W9_9ACTN|nr:acyl-CoA carboxylase epsilon subunit [Acrocarpospora phusangensis]GIH21983.1 hypothetical protein Aph01nite_02930 [Acrocarpospora phusangensis]